MGESGVPPDALDSRVDALAESWQLFHRGVGQRGGVQMIPERLDRIQFWRVGGQPFDAQPFPVPGQRLRHQPTAVGGQAIPEQNHWAAAVASQRVQEAHHLGAPDTPAMQRQQPAAAVAAGLGEHRSDAGQRLPVEGFHQPWSLPAGRPGGPDRGPLGKPALVQKAQPGFQPLGVFFTCGQRTRTQRVMAGSSRSLARRAGRWRLQPSWPSSLQVCANEYRT